MALYRTYGSSTNRRTYPITHWVCFRGESSVTVRDSGNVSSITDYGTGYFGINLAQNMPDTNYCIFGNTIKGDANDDGNAGLCAGGCDNSIQIYTSGCRCRTKVMSNNDSQDTQYAHVAFTR
tara:strand:- start:950 stop:1315 length:366 start_codon:yes stop_codon:yes gene_type:complete